MVCIVLVVYFTKVRSKISNSEISPGEFILERKNGFIFISFVRKMKIPSLLAFCVGVLLIVAAQNHVNAIFIPKDPNLIGIYRTMLNLKEKYGVSVSSVLDVGANSGSWSTSFKRHFPNASFFLIEGNDELTGALKSAGFPFHIGLVGDNARQVNYFKSKSPGGTGNSIFKEQGWNNPAVKTMMLPIDTIVQHYKAGPFDFVKIDVQGAELLALKGAVNTLKSVQMLTTEMSIMNFNNGGAVFFELLDALHAAGFEMFDIFSIMRGRGHMAVQMDGLFVRNNAKLWDHADIAGMNHLNSVDKRARNGRLNTHSTFSGYVQTVGTWSQRCRFKLDNDN
jgi:FkbM family methyltransferase